MPLLDHLWLLLHPVVLLDQDVPKTTTSFESHSLIFVSLYRMHGLHLNISLGTYRKTCGASGASLSINTCLSLKKNKKTKTSLCINKQQQVQYSNLYYNIKTSLQVVLFNLHCVQGHPALLFLPGLQKDPWFIHANLVK